MHQLIARRLTYRPNYKLDSDSQIRVIALGLANIEVSNFDLHSSLHIISSTAKRFTVVKTISIRS